MKKRKGHLIFASFSRVTSCPSFPSTFIGDLIDKSGGGWWAGRDGVAVIIAIPAAGKKVIKAALKPCRVKKE